MTTEPLENVAVKALAAMDPPKAKKAVFVLVPGAWHSTNYLEPTQDYLREMGYDSVAVSHQTLEPINPGTSVFDDAAKLERIVKEILDARKNVIVVMHSYGGCVGSQAIGHLLSTMIESIPSSDDSNKAGQMGKVLHLVYVAALIPQEGETGAALSALVTADNTTVQGAGWNLPVDVVDGKLLCKEEMKELFYGDLPDPDDRDRYFGLLQAWPVNGMPDAPTHFGWRHVPSTYVCATNDRVVSRNAQKRMWTRAREALSSSTPSCCGSSKDSGPAASTAACLGECVGPKDSHCAAEGGCMAVKVIESDHCSMFILRKHVEVLGSMLVEIGESERQEKE